MQNITNCIIKMKALLYLVLITFNCAGQRYETFSHPGRTDSLRTAENKLLKKLMASDDKELMLLLKRRKKYSRARLIGLGAIPAVFFGSTAMMASEPLFGGGPQTKKDFHLRDGGRTLLGVGALCITGNIYFSFKRKAFRKKAIAKYNQLYN